MIQLLFCLFLLLPLTAISIGAFFISTTAGVVAVVVAIILASPLLLSAVAHFDLLRVKSRYGLSDDEVKAFTRLVPQLAGRHEFAGRKPAEIQQAAKHTAATFIIRERREQAHRSETP